MRLMVSYKGYLIDSDMAYRKRGHIYYLLGDTGQTGEMVASYSLKTGRLILLNAVYHIPPEHILVDFVARCEAKKNNGTVHR